MRVTCTTCKAELEIHAGDLKEDSGDGSYPTTYYYNAHVVTSEITWATQTLQKKFYSTLINYVQSITTLSKIYRGWLFLFNETVIQK